MIEEHIEDFLAYLDINRSMFFSSECEIYIFCFFFLFLKSHDSLELHLQVKTTKMLRRIICCVADQQNKDWAKLI